MNIHGVFIRKRVMERDEHHEDDVIELGVATVETKGGGFAGESLGNGASYELSDQ
jgi:hypothetical protein